MKVGDEFALNIEGHKVGSAKIIAVNADNTVELKFDGGRAVFQTKTYIEQAPKPQSQEHALLGVENISEGPIPTGEPIPPTAVNAENISSETVSAATPQPETQPSPASPSSAPVAEPAQGPEQPAVNNVGDTTVVQNEVVTPEVSNEDTKDS